MRSNTVRYTRHDDSSPKLPSAAFTLVEILVVLGIIGILTAVTLPAISGMSKASRGTAALALMMYAYDQARNLAITQAAPTYLYMATAESTWPQEYKGRAFAIFTETYSPGTETYVQTPLGKWNSLPDGVAFKQSEDTIFGTAKGKAYFPQAKAELPVGMIKFSPTGAIETPSTTDFARLRLFEGSFDGQGNAIPTKPDQTGDYNLRLVLLTGRAMREEALSKP